MADVSFTTESEAIAFAKEKGIPEAKIRHTGVVFTVTTDKDDDDEKKPATSSTSTQQK